MRTVIATSGQAGRIIRRIRNELGISRSELARRASVSPRTLFAFEQGQNDNIGLAAFLRLASALKLDISIDDGVASKAGSTKAVAAIAEFDPEWDKLSDVWSLGGDRS